MPDGPHPQPALLALEGRAPLPAGGRLARDPARRRSRDLAGRDGRARRALRHRQVDACSTSRACSRSPTAARSSSAAADRRDERPERTRLRREELGFVYQFHHLLPEFSALENVVMPQLDPRPPRRRMRAARASQILTFLGLGERLDHRPANCPAASSSASPSPARSPTRRACCWPTSRPATSTRTPPTTSFRRWSRSCAPRGSPRSSRPTTGTRRAHGPARDDPRRADRPAAVMAAVRHPAAARPAERQCRR